MTFSKWADEKKKLLKEEEEKAHGFINNASLVSRIEMAEQIYELYAAEALARQEHASGTRICCKYSGPPFVKCGVCGGRLSI